MKKRRKTKFIKILDVDCGEMRWYELVEFRGQPALRRAQLGRRGLWHDQTAPSCVERRLIGFINRKGEFQFFYPCTIGSSAGYVYKPARKRVNPDGTWTTVNRDRKGQTTRITSPHHYDVFACFLREATTYYLEKLVLDKKPS